MQPPAPYGVAAAPGDTHKGGAGGAQAPNQHWRCHQTTPKNLLPVPSKGPITAPAPCGGPHGWGPCPPPTTMPTGAVMQGPSHDSRSRSWWPGKWDC